MDFKQIQVKVVFIDVVLLNEILVIRKRSCGKKAIRFGGVGSN